MHTTTIITLLLALVFTFGLLFAGKISKTVRFTISESKYLNQQFNYQLIALGISLLSLLFTYMLNPENFTKYFSLGNISASAQELQLFGIKKGDSWLKTGLSLSLVISLVTSIFMYFQLKQAKPDRRKLAKGLIWVLLFSLTNSFTEEAIYRIGIVSPLIDLYTPTIIFTISAILFGLPHFAGMPNGIIGASMAGILGFVLAKSMHETNGIFWAWLIHFLQDVIIIGTLFVIKNKTN